MRGWPPMRRLGRVVASPRGGKQEVVYLCIFKL